MSFVRDWLARVLSRELTEEERWYALQSWKRYDFVLKRVEEAVARLERAGRTKLKLLDVAPHFLTSVVQERFPNLAINTLGFEDRRLYPGANIGQHFPFDLNDAQFSDRWPRFGLHDIIIAGEVIEHLYTAPSLVLGFLASLLMPGGKLILTTPNAVAVARRVALALGRHPYEMLRESRSNPGHVREYTWRELESAGKSAGLVTFRAYLVNYFAHDRPITTAVYKVCGVVPSLRDGITMVFDKPNEALLPQLGQGRSRP